MPIGCGVSMRELIWLIPLVPLLSAIVLMVLPQCTAKVLPQPLIAAIGVGSVGVAMLLTLTLVLSGGPYPIEQTLWTWMAIGNFNPGVSFYIDGLTLVMMSIITGVGFLIHVFSSEFMLGDHSYARYFAFLNLFVAAMLRSVCTLARQLSVLEIGLPLVVFDLQWFLRLHQVRVNIRFCFQSNLQS